MFARRAGSMTILPSLGSGRFGPPVSTPWLSWRHVIADANDDGWLDLLDPRSAGSNHVTVRIQLGLGDFTFGPPTTLGDFYPTSMSLAVEDIDGDGHTDIVASFGALELYRGLGGGLFAPPQRTWCGGAYNSPPLFADMDDDGAKDLVQRAHLSNTVRVLAQR